MSRITPFPGGRVPVVVSLRRIRERGERRDRAYGAGTPDAVLHVSWTAAEWREWCAGRGYALSPSDPLAATCVDGAGTRWAILCSPDLPIERIGPWGALPAPEEPFTLPLAA